MAFDSTMIAGIILAVTLATACAKQLNGVSSKISTLEADLMAELAFNGLEKTGVTAGAEAQALVAKRATFREAVRRYGIVPCTTDEWVSQCDVGEACLPFNKNRGFHVAGGLLQPYSKFRDKGIYVTSREDEWISASKAVCFEDFTTANNDKTFTYQGKKSNIRMPQNIHTDPDGCCISEERLKRYPGYDSSSALQGMWQAAVRNNLVVPDVPLVPAEPRPQCFLNHGDCASHEIILVASVQGTKVRVPCCLFDQDTEDYGKCTTPEAFKTFNGTIANTTMNKCQFSGCSLECPES